MKSKTKIMSLVVVLAIGTLGFAVYPYLSCEYLGWQFEHEVKKQPLFALIAKNYPKEFAIYLGNVKKALKEHHDNVIQSHSAQLVNKIFYQSLQQAPDDYIDLYLKATLDLYHYLNGQDPRAVVKLENPENNIDYDLNLLFEKNDFQTRLVHLLDTKRFVIEASIKTPSQLSKQQAEPLLRGILSDLDNKFSESVVKGAFAGKQIPPKVASEIIIEFYTHILGKGKENAGNIMRYIAHLKNIPLNYED